MKGHTHGSLDATGTVAHGIVLKQCPITSGRPTRMTRAGFVRACERERETGMKYTYNFGTTSVRTMARWCDQCQGKPPSELEIIPLAEIRTLNTQHKNAVNAAATTLEGESMPSKRIKGVCEGGCGEPGSLAQNYEVRMCGTCSIIHTHVRNRGPVVVDAIRRVGMLDWYVGQLIDGEDKVALSLESAALEQIAAIIGYEGTDGDGLLEAVRRATDWTMQQPQITDLLLRLRTALKRPAGPVEELAEDVELLITNHQLPAKDAPGPGAVLIALDCNHDNWQMAAIHTAALLDDAQRYNVGGGGRKAIQGLRQMRDALGLPATTYLPDADQVLIAIGGLTQAMDMRRDQVAVATDKALVLEARIEELEQEKAVAEQMVELIGEALDHPGIRLGDIANAIDTLRALPDMVPLNGYTYPTLTPSATAIDSHLLDLVLDYPGIPLDRIAMIREAV